MGMPVRSTRQTNGDGAPALPNLPPGVQGNPDSYNPVIRIQNIPLTSLPSGSLPSSVGGGGGGYLDPETGDWVAQTSTK